MNIILILLVAGGIYWADLWRHPWRPCRTCKGSKGHRSKVAQGAYGKCWSCDGRGQKARLTARFLLPKTYVAMRERRSGRNF